MRKNGAQRNGWRGNGYSQAEPVASQEVHVTQSSDGGELGALEDPGARDGSSGHSG